MPTFESLLFLLMCLTAAVGGLALFVALRQARTSPATEALSRGDFRLALDSADTGEDSHREELYCAAVAAKHLLRFTLSQELLERILGEDPDDGEAWLELALVKAYRGDLQGGTDALSQVERRRSDLWESMTLHRAWLELLQENRQVARRLFEEVEVPLETKLRTDMGEGEPLFVEWFLQAAALWRAFGNQEKASWARETASSTAPQSRLSELILGG